METIKRWNMEDPGYGRSPAICALSGGRFAVAWISWTDQGECIRVSFGAPTGRFDAPHAITPNLSFITGMDIAAFGELVRVIYTGAAGLQVLIVSSEGVVTGMPVTVAGETPMHPDLSACPSVEGHRFAVTWTESREGQRVVMACMGDGAEGLDSPVEIAGGGAHHTRPRVVCEEDAAWVVWQSMSEGDCRVVARRFGGNADSGEIDISPRMRGICAMPDAARSKDGIFVAWQSDYDEASGPGLVRWIEVAHIGSDGKRSVPRIPMPGVARDGEGEDQGFEMPALSVLSDGRLAIVGRGSQSIRRQDWGEAGWSQPLQVDEPGWRCRGRRISAASVNEGLMIAVREKSGVTLSLQDLGSQEHGGAPLIRDARAGSNGNRFSPERHDNIVAGKRVLFGDIHQHTAASDSTGSFEEVYCRARYRYGDQIAAISDHESFLGKRTPPGEWAEARIAGDEANRDGAFIVLSAFEWTGKMHPGPGHKVVYFHRDGGPVLSRDDDKTSTSGGLIREARRFGGLVFPHHVGWTGADLDAHDSSVQTCFEIVSCHGAYERPEFGPIGTRGDDKPGQFVAEALDAGHRFGFVGGSDGHGLNWHHGISRKQDSHRTGLTAVFPTEMTRTGVTEALRSRRCYATSGAKIRLWFEVDGRPMGEELVSSDPLPYRVVVSATDSVGSLALVSAHGVETELDTSGTEADIRGMVMPPNSDSSCYYFVRVVQMDGEVAWSSPIWVDYPETA